MKKMVTYIDPPSGWKYGFPMSVPDPQPEGMLKWLVEQGYQDAKQFLLPLLAGRSIR